MNWQLINTGLNTGTFNMELDIKFAANINSDETILRLYRWEPYCISLGANQNYDSVDIKKAADDNINIVKRPTGGRAILHAEELTYSVIHPLSEGKSPKQIYRDINLALKCGLKNYNTLLDAIELENTQPDFHSFYREEISTLCFAVSAMNELNFEGKKVVGSAQRRIRNVVLQHGSILCGSFHKRIVHYLNLDQDKLEEAEVELNRTTTELETILNEKINYEKLSDSIISGFEEHFKIKFEEVAEEIIS